MGSRIHLTLEQCEPGNLPFDLPSPPGFSESSLNRWELSLQPLSKAPQFLIGAPFGPLQPRKECLAFPLTDETNKSLPERGNRPKARRKTKQCLPIVRIRSLQFSWLAS